MERHLLLIDDDDDEFDLLTSATQGISHLKCLYASSGNKGMIL